MISEAIPLKGLPINRLKNQARTKDRLAKFEKAAAPYKKSIAESDKIINKNKPKAEDPFGFGDKKDPLDASLN